MQDSALTIQQKQPEKEETPDLAAESTFHLEKAVKKDEESSSSSSSTLMAKLKKKRQPLPEVGGSPQYYHSLLENFSKDMISFSEKVKGRELCC